MVFLDSSLLTEVKWGGEVARSDCACGKSPGGGVIAVPAVEHVKRVFAPAYDS